MGGSIVLTVYQSKHTALHHFIIAKPKTAFDNYYRSTSIYVKFGAFNPHCYRYK